MTSSSLRFSRIVSWISDSAVERHCLSLSSAIASNCEAMGSWEDRPAAAGRAADPWEDGGRSATLLRGERGCGESEAEKRRWFGKPWRPYCEAGAN